MTQPVPEPCPECGQPIVDRDPDAMHSLNDDDARRLDVDPGEYHVDCCPKCEAGENLHDGSDEYEAFG